MWDMVPRKVLVGIETADCLPALSLAAEEAVRRGCGVHLVHVLPRPTPATRTSTSSSWWPASCSGQVRLSSGEPRGRCSDMLPDDLVVSTELRHGTVFSCLVEASAHACLLVLQHRDRVTTASPTCCRRSTPWWPPPTVRCWWSRRRGRAKSRLSAPWCSPVWTWRPVPRTWSSWPWPRHPGVTRGCGLFTAPRARLGGVEDIDPTAYAAWLRRAQRELEADFSALTGSQPDVAVELEVVPEAPATALVAKARGAAVVVMGRGHRGLPFVKRLGPVTGEVLRLRRMPGAGRRREPSDPRSAPTRALAGRHRMRPRVFVPRPPVFGSTASGAQEQDQ